jgi:S-formylglutathione hydrolase
MPSSTIELHEFETELVPSPVPYAVLLPDGLDALEGPIPLCLHLHGGGGSRDELVTNKPLYDHQWSTGQLPPMVIATPSTPPVGYYMDAQDGSERWESFIMEELLPHLRKTYSAGPDRSSTVLIGASMGGYGSLKLAFRHPEEFGVVVAIEPAIFPGVEPDDVRPRNRVLGPEIQRSLFGDPPDAEHFRTNNPASILKAHAEEIRRQDLRIYIEVGDGDSLRLHDGTEFLHRLLWSLDIPHEYHLVHGAGHLGPSLPRRILEAQEFLGRALMAEPEPDLTKLTPEEQRYIEALEAGEAAPTMPVTPIDPRAEGLFRLALSDRFAKADQEDPTGSRNFGPLPPC